MSGCGLVPMHYAKSISGFNGGIEYVISFGIGAFTVTLLFWVTYMLSFFNCGTADSSHCI